MPYSANNPPKVAKNWNKNEQHKCIVAANSVLSKGGSEKDAVFACINAAGKSKKRTDEESLLQESSTGKKEQEIREIREVTTKDKALSYRTLKVEVADDQQRSPATINLDEKSVDIILTTESPVMMPDWQRYEMIPEVLLMESAHIPQSRQVPLLDSHKRGSIGDIVGSVRGIKRDEDRLVGKAKFAEDEEGNKAFNKVKDGHLTDLSIGYIIKKKVFIPKGEKSVVKGKEYEGPISVVTDWHLKECSVTPIGADSRSKIRSDTGDPFTEELEEKKSESEDAIVNTNKELEMDEKLRSLLVEKGMPSDYTDEQAREWMVQFLSQKTEKPAEANEDKTPKVDLATLVTKAINEHFAQEAKQREQLRTDIKKLCEKYKVTDRQDEVLNCLTLSEARERVLEILSEKQTPVPFTYIEPGDSSLDKFRGAIGTALTIRALSGFNEDIRSQAFAKEQHKTGHETFRYSGLYDFAAECLRAEGLDIRGWPRQEVAKAALGFHPVVKRAGFHYTGMFPQLVLDAVNKTLLAGYIEIMPTWKLVFRQGESAPDLKTIHRIRMGAIPNLPLWDTREKPEELSFADEKESYSVLPHAGIISFTWDMVVNDDMSAINRIPRNMGQAAARTVNKEAWAQITSNPTMVDGQALFLETPAGNRKNGNLLTTATTPPSVAAVQSLAALMALQTGVNTRGGNESDDILGITPAFLVVPAALRVTAEQLVKSTADPADNKSSGVHNPWQFLRTVVEPLLDGNSTTAWYLFADPNQIDTVEVTFLSGEETPVTNNWIDEEQECHKYKVRQTFAAKAIDFRGVAQQSGVA